MSPRGGWRAAPWIAVVAVTMAGGVWMISDNEPQPPPRAERIAYAPVRGPLTFPAEVQTADRGLRELYEFAARRPDVMHYVPCFCGCGNVGHRSAYDCFIDEVRPDGAVSIDEMGFT